VGPFDPTDRFTYWPVRVSRGGEVLAPGDPGRLVQVIDVRDLAKWIVGMAASKSGGTFNACGPSIPFQQVLESCLEETGGESRFTWADSAFLSKENVAPYTDLPLWIPACNDTFKVDAAWKRGLVSRPLRETIRDTLAWYRSGAPRWPLHSGLDSEREAKLLERWKEERATESRCCGAVLKKSYPGCR
jgi:2'-hydroxyisoflavone reductase